MKLHLAGQTGQNVFTAYGAGWVMVAGVRYQASLVVTPDRLIEGWTPASFEALAPEHFAPIVELAPEIVLLGTGAKLRFPRPEIVRPLIDARIGMEVMDVQAACRTYNILLGEDRKVLAALVLG